MTRGARVAERVVVQQHGATAIGAMHLHRVGGGRRRAAGTRRHTWRHAACDGRDHEDPYGAAVERAARHKIVPAAVVAAAGAARLGEGEERPARRLDGRGDPVARARRARGIREARVKATAMHPLRSPGIGPGRV